MTRFRKQCMGSSKDQLSDLPDEMLLDILSRLNVRQAASTSILSKRWRYLWLSTPCLDFKDPMLSALSLDEFTEMVDGILQHRGKDTPLHEFCIDYPLLESSRSQLDRWLDFAISAGASKIELHLDGFTRHCCYEVPLEVFTRTPAPGFNYRLKDLILRQTRLHDDLFETILLTCPSLERLVLEYGMKQHNTICTVPHKKLKHLMLFCQLLLSLYIVVPNLVTFNFVGRRADIFIEGSPTLENILITSPLKEQKDMVFSQLPAHTFLSVKCLILDIMSFLARIRTEKPIPPMTNLRRLCLVDEVGHSIALCHRATIDLLAASTLLERVELQMCSRYHKLDEFEDITMSPHRNLKEVMMSNFHGYEAEIQLLTIIVDHAIASEKIEVSPKAVWYHFFCGSQILKEHDTNKEVIEEGVDKLRAI